MRMDSATSFQQGRGVVFVLPQERIEKAGGAGVLAQFAVLQEHVHGFPQRVIKNLDRFLMDEGVVGDGGEAETVMARLAHAPVSSAACTSISPSGGANPITMSSGRTSASSQGANAAERSSAGSARLPTITGCTNSTDTCCASVAQGPRPKASNRPPRRKRSAISLRHGGQARSFVREEILEDAIALQQPFGDLLGEAWTAWGS